MVNYQEVDLKPWEYKEEVFKSINVKIESPDGTMYVTILENEGLMPFRVMINIGKAGSPLNAWAYALADFVSDALPRIGLNSVISKLLSIHSDKVAIVPDTLTNEGIITVRSGPEAIAYALIKYRTEKQREYHKRIGINEDDDFEDHFRPAISK